MENKSQKHIVIANRDCDAKNENEVPVLCPNDHTLSQFQAPTYYFSCDGCEQMVLLGAPLYGCRSCNYDLCTVCYQTKSHLIQPIDVSSISCNDRIISQMNRVLNTSNRPSIEKLIIDGILQIDSVNQYYTFDVHTINNMIRDSHELHYNPHLIEVLQQYPGDTAHFNTDDFELLYKEQRSTELLLTVSEGLQNACILARVQEKETQLHLISAKQNAIHAQLRALHGVENDMINLNHTCYSEYYSIYSRIATIDADIKQLRDHKNQPRVQDAIDVLMMHKTNAEHVMRNVSTRTMLKTHDLIRQICISRTVGTQYANQFRLTFEYSLFVVNILYLQYVDTLFVPIQFTIAAYASDYLQINDTSTVRDLLRQMDVNTYATHHSQSMDGQSQKHVVITNCDYIAQNDDELSFNNGDEIIVLNEDANGTWKGRLKRNNKIGLLSIDCIRIDSIDINRVCFCKKPLKRHRITLKQWTCHCCNKIITNETEYYQCGRLKQCNYVQIVERHVYQMCSQCFSTQNEKVSDDTPYNDLILIKTRAMMKRMNESAMQSLSSEELQAYVLRVYRGLYINWISKLSDTDFAASIQHKLVLDEFDAFYGALLSKLSVDTSNPFQKVKCIQITVGLYLQLLYLYIGPVLFSM